MKIWKYIAGFFTLLGGILIAFLSGRSAGRKDEKLKGFKSDLKNLKTDRKVIKKETKKVGEIIAAKNKKIKDLKKQQPKKKKLSASEKYNRLKKISKGG